MRSLYRIASIFATPLGFISCTFAVLGALTLLFVLSEYALVGEVLAGKFPLSLFIAVMPNILASFFLAGGTILFLHYLLFSFLFGVYVMLLVHIFIKKKYFSASSFSISALSLVGISFGISCLSCGALAGVLLFSLVGATTASIVTTAFGSTLFFFAGEALLGISIALALVTINRFERPYGK